MTEEYGVAPQLSVLLSFGGDSARAEEALRALSPSLQRNLGEKDYEILALEWESTDRLGEARATVHGRNVRYFQCKEEPVGLEAARFALKHARAPFIGIAAGAIVLLTPRTLEHALLAERVDPDPLVVVPSYQIFEIRQDGVATQKLASTDGLHWGSLGYRLFEYARFSTPFERGFLSPLAEANCVFARRGSLESALDASVASDMPLLGRLAARPKARLVVLAGEGAFVHSSNPTPGESASVPRASVPTREPLVLGDFPGEAQRFVVEAVDWASVFHALTAEAGHPAYPMDP